MLNQNPIYTDEKKQGHHFFFKRNIQLKLRGIRILLGMLRVIILVLMTWLRSSEN